MESIFDQFMKCRREGLGAAAAAELVGRRYGRTAPADLVELERTLSQIERRRGGEVTTPTTPSSLYLEERRLGASHVQALLAVGHAYGRRTRQQSEELIGRAREAFEREQMAMCPGVTPNSSEVMA